MAITDLTGTKWEFESPISAHNDSFAVTNLYFTSNNENFDKLSVVGIGQSYSTIKYENTSTSISITVYNKGWSNESYRTIEITGGSSTALTNNTVIDFLEAHATQVVEPTDVMISYGGSYIATMSDSGTEVLETSGTFLTDDIKIKYIKSGGGTPTLQSKTVSPTTSQQTVIADSGYDGLSSVQINAMPIGTVALRDITISENSFNDITDSVSNSGLVSTTFDLDTDYYNEIDFHDGYIDNITGNGMLQGYFTHTYQLPTQAAQTITPTTSNQTITSGKYLIGNQTILGDSNLISNNIKVGTSIFGVQGGYSNYRLIHSSTISASVTNTSATRVTTISVPNAYTSNAILYVKIRDTAGPRLGHYLGSDCYCFNYQAANNSTSAATQWAKAIHRYATGGTVSTYAGGTTVGYGLYPYHVKGDGGEIQIYGRYNSSYSLIIDGTYRIEVYLLDYVGDDGNPYEYTNGIEPIDDR